MFNKVFFCLSLLIALGGNLVISKESLASSLTLFPGGPHGGNDDVLKVTATHPIDGSEDFLQEYDPGVRKNPPYCADNGLISEYDYKKFKCSLTKEEAIPFDEKELYQLAGKWTKEHNKDEFSHDLRKFSLIKLIQQKAQIFKLFPKLSPRSMPKLANAKLADDYNFMPLQAGVPLSVTNECANNDPEVLATITHFREKLNAPKNKNGDQKMSTAFLSKLISKAIITPDVFKEKQKIEKKLKAQIKYAKLVKKKLDRLAHTIDSHKLPCSEGTRNLSCAQNYKQYASTLKRIEFYAQNIENFKKQLKHLKKHLYSDPLITRNTNLAELTSDKIALSSFTTSAISFFDNYQFQKSALFIKGEQEDKSNGEVFSKYILKILNSKDPKKIAQAYVVLESILNAEPELKEKLMQLAQKETKSQIKIIDETMGQMCSSDGHEKLHHHQGLVEQMILAKINNHKKDERKNIIGAAQRIHCDLLKEIPLDDGSLGTKVLLGSGVVLAGALLTGPIGWTTAGLSLAAAGIPLGAYGIYEAVQSNERSEISMGLVTIGAEDVEAARKDLSRARTNNVLAGLDIVLLPLDGMLIAKAIAKKVSKKFNITDQDKVNIKRSSIFKEQIDLFPRDQRDEVALILIAGKKKFPNLNEEELIAKLKSSPYNLGLCVPKKL